MKKQTKYFTLSMITVLLGIGLMVFLYFFPYSKVQTYAFHEVLNPISIRLEDEKIKKHDAIRDISSSIEYLVIDDEDELKICEEKLNYNISNKLSSSFYQSSSIALISFKGSVMRYSKATKCKVSNDAVNINFSIENDFILDGSASAEEEIYSYYFIPIKAKNIKSLNILIKKV